MRGNLGFWHSHECHLTHTTHLNTVADRVHSLMLRLVDVHWVSVNHSVNQCLHMFHVHFLNSCQSLSFKPLWLSSLSAITVPNVVFPPNPSTPEMWRNNENTVNSKQWITPQRGKVVLKWQLFLFPCHNSDLCAICTPQDSRHSKYKKLPSIFLVVENELSLPVPAIEAQF